MILDIEEEKNFHSFILCRTMNKVLAEQFPNTVFSHNNQIIHDSYEKYKDCLQFNYPINAIKYQYVNHQIILAQADFLVNLLPEKVISQYRIHKIIIFNDNQLLKEVQFYIYLKDKTFLLIKPYLYLDGILFFDVKDEKRMICSQKFKEINTVHVINKTKFKTIDEFFHFQHEFALLSDIHFLECFTPGYRKSSSYLKVQQKYMQTIDESLYKNIIKYFNKPSL